MFSETDNKEHAKLKRPVVRHFSVPSVLAMEPHMDKTIEEFCDHLERRFVEPSKACEFGDWLAYCKLEAACSDFSIAWLMQSLLCRCVGLSWLRHV